MQNSSMTRALCVAVLGLGWALPAIAQTAPPASPPVVLRLAALTVAQSADRPTAPYAGQPLAPGAVIRYVISASNKGATPVFHLIPSDRIPVGTEYVLGSAERANGLPEFTLDGRTWSAEPTVLVKNPTTGALEPHPAPAAAYRAVRWITRTPLAVKASAQFAFDVRVKS